MKDTDIVRDLSLLLLYMTSWKENAGTDFEVLRSWRSYDWDALDTLEDSKLISYNRTAKSVYLTDKGTAAAQKIYDSLVNLEELEPED